MWRSSRRIIRTGRRRKRLRLPPKWHCIPRKVKQLPCSRTRIVLRSNVIASLQSAPSLAVAIIAVPVSVPVAVTSPMHPLGRPVLILIEYRFGPTRLILALVIHAGTRPSYGVSTRGPASRYAPTRPSAATAGPAHSTASTVAVAKFKGRVPSVLLAAKVQRKRARAVLKSGTHRD